MTLPMNRRSMLQTLAASGGAVLGSSMFGGGGAAWADRTKSDPKWVKATENGLKWVAKEQSRMGHWMASTMAYPTAMTALAGTALVCSGSTTVQGPYAKNIRRAVDYLMSRQRPNGLIGDPQSDQQYTYGHGFSMLFLSQILGEEEDEERRKELTEVLTRSVQFCVEAQTPAGGWGYVSAKDGNNFDEGSTTITQVQGLRGCRNAGIPVPKEAIDKAKEYIYYCKNADGGISYSSKNRGSSRPAITAAALAALYNAGDYDSKHVPEMMKYAEQQLGRIGDEASAFGHWHYTYLYYAQVVYRQGADKWEPFRDKLFAKIVTDQTGDGSWQGNIGPIYVTSLNLIMLQLDKGVLPIFQR